MVKLLDDIFSKIPHDAKYQGYVWFSDSREPVTLVDEGLPEFPGQEDKRFVVEALLYDPAGKKSFFAFHNGELVVQEFNLETIAQEFECAEGPFFFHPYRLDKRVRFLKFWEVWMSEKDPFCADMEVLCFQQYVFCGFDLK
ncbi:MAG: TIGR04423 family type III CRISPR-associated protein [Methanobacteriota archaeon]|nr:MAG: TIGR04423 family type III CRISPR-associated protein [Euryarchaeota archaeon]